MKIFLTGATGFVGRHAAAALAEAGHTLVCLVRDPTRATHLETAGHTLVVGGILDRPALERGIDGVDAVVHVAGLIAARSQAAMHAVNVTGAGLLAGVAAQAQTPRRMVLVSSLAAGGPGLPDAPRGEDDPVRPVSWYGLTKLHGEHAARRALGAPERLVVIRPPAVYGPHDRGVLEFFKTAAAGVRPRIGAAPRWVSIVHGADLARLIVAAVENEQAGGHTFHSANATPHSIDDLLERIAATVGRPTRSLPVPECVVRAAGFAIETVARLRGQVPAFSRDKVHEILAPGWVCSSERAASVLGWRAEIDLDAGLHATAVWYREHGLIPAG